MTCIQMARGLEDEEITQEVKKAREYHKKHYQKNKEKLTGKEEE